MSSTFDYGGWFEIGETNEFNISRSIYTKEVAGEGIILNLEGHLETNFVWGLGNSTNNQVEMYALSSRYSFSNKPRIKILISIGNLSIPINSVVLKKLLQIVSVLNNSTSEGSLKNLKGLFLLDSKGILLFN